MILLSSHDFNLKSWFYYQAVILLSTKLSQKAHALQLNNLHVSTKYYYYYITSNRRRITNEIQSYIGNMVLPNIKN